MSKFDASNQVKKMIKMAKLVSKNKGTCNLPRNYGDLLLEQEKVNKDYKILLEKARNGGASDDDIREWWDSNDLERQVARGFSTQFNAMGWIIERDKGLNDEQAGINLRKAMPVYGNPDDLSILKGDDRPLPYELLFRIDRYLKRVLMTDDKKIGYLNKKELFSSFNAFIRNEIREGNI